MLAFLKLIHMQDIYYSTRKESSFVLVQCDKSQVVHALWSMEKIRLPFGEIEFPC